MPQDNTLEAGEEIDAVSVTAHGLQGDRAYALADTVTGKIAARRA